MAEAHSINHIRRYSKQNMNSEMPSIPKCYSLHSVASTATIKHSNISKRSVHQIKESRTRTFLKTITTPCIPSDLFELRDSNEVLDDSKKTYRVQELLTKTLKPTLIEHLQKIRQDIVPYDESDSISFLPEPTLQSKNRMESSIADSRLLRLSTISSSRSKKSPHSEHQIKACAVSQVKRHSWRY